MLLKTSCFYSYILYSVFIAKNLVSIHHSTVDPHLLSLNPSHFSSLVIITVFLYLCVYFLFGLVCSFYFVFYLLIRLKNFFIGGW